jgi:hypothetical protein
LFSFFQDYALDRFNAYFQQKKAVEISLIGRHSNGVVSHQIARSPKIVETTVNGNP